VAPKERHGDGWVIAFAPDLSPWFFPALSNAQSTGNAKILRRGTSGAERVLDA
jgi:hypothetical protein